ncbi:MAG: chromosome segregation protein SMC [Planctomycetes bacterium]|nr:chromosome segregation protein SMC [Planctomycetota bacterium]
MKLTRLTLEGFKSFAHRTEVNFDYGTTILVGPNGCGKSNVVDSIKWVLGDRSVKSLRSEEMLDVIFNGASDAKPAGFAAVSLSFANSTGAPDAAKLPMDYEEITVTRRLHRSGESEYLLNNQPCRLKDIRELFMGTGVGMESYSIIEQGKVDFILRSNPFERRELLDEAAGISKYKAKRKESESKLLKVEQDLLRLTDILREVRREIRSIKIQATKAEKYKATLEELRAKKTQLSLHTYHQYFQKQAELTAKNTELKAGYETLNTRLRAIEEVIVAIDREIIQIDNSSAGHQDALVNLSGRISQTQQRIESSVTRRNELVQSEEETKNNIATYTQKAIDLRSRIVEVMQSYETVKREIETLETGLSEQDALYKDISRELENVGLKLEEKRNETFQTSHKKSNYQNELFSIQAELKNLAARREKFTARIKEIEIETETLKQNKSGLESSRRQVDDVINNLKTDIAQKEMVLKAIQNDLAGISAEFNKVKDDLNRISSRKEVLEDLELHHEGCSNGVRSVLESRSSIAANIYGLVADIVEVKPQYVNAAEAGLKGIADALIVQSQADALSVIQFVRDSQKGRVTAIAIDKLKSFSLRPPIPANNIAGIIGYADEIIQSVKLDNITPEMKSALARVLLGQYLLVDNSATAQQVLSEHLYDGPILTVNGEIINPNGIISGGSIDAGLGLISRKTELRDLNGKLLALAEQLKTLEQMQSNKAAEIDALQMELQKSRISVYEKSVELTTADNAVSELDRRLAILAKEMEISNLEHAEVAQQIQSLSDRAITTAQFVKELEAALVKIQAEIEQANNAANEYAQKKQQIETQVTELKVKQAKLLSQREHFTQQQAQMNEDIKHLEAVLEASANSLNEIKNRIIELDTARTADEQLLKELAEEQARVQSLVTEFRTRTQELKEKLGLQKTDEEKVLLEINTIQNSISETSYQERETTLKLDNLCEKHKEETGADLKALCEAMVGSIQPAAEAHREASYQSYQPQTEAQDAQNAEDWQKVNQTIEELKSRLGDMTDVNLSAIDQLKSLEERNATLTVQEQDLAKSKEALQEFIRKTNRECRERFEKTFVQVAENFSQLFRKLFGGGRAELTLEKRSEIEAIPDSTVIPAEAVISANGETSPSGVQTEGQASVSPEATPGRRHNSNDLLEVGIDIIAKPPGKEPTSISLLSGGEKALTALALVMAIFKLQPSPFCILDEADSPLDENNVDRFCAMIKEFAVETQFIVITHNKKTMLSGDVMYGLTMPTPGISKKVSIKMDEVDKFVAENPDAAPDKKSPVQPALQQA